MNKSRPRILIVDDQKSIRRTMTGIIEDVGFQVMDVTGLPSGTVYPVLRRLESELAVESEWEDAETASSAGRRARRVYTLTEAGQMWAERARQRLADTHRMLADSALRHVTPRGADGS